MQLTHGMDCPPGADSTAAAVPLPLQVHAVSTNVADAVQQVDLLVSANTSQADVRVAVPVANTLAVVNTQQLSAAAVPPMMGNVWHSKPMSSFPVAAATPILKRQCSLSGHRWHPMKSRCHHGSGVPPCPDCRRAGLGSGSR